MTWLLIIWLTLFLISVIWFWLMRPEGWSGEDDADHDPPDIDQDDDEEDCKPQDLLRLRQEDL